MTDQPSSNTPRSTSRRGFLRGLGIGAVGLVSGVTGGLLSGNLVSRWYENLMAAPNSPREGVAAPPTTITTSDGLKIHHIQTGFVAVKRVHREYDGPDGQGILAIATAREWTEWMPITAWAIEHPEGVLLVDSGEIPQASNPTYYACDPGSAFFYSSFLRFSVTPEEEIAAQLAGLGIQPRDVRWVAQTHLHGDHIHGLKHFDRAEVFVSPLDYPTSLGAVPCLYPDWLAPTLVEFTPDDLPGFGRSRRITSAGDVVIVPTPGHSGGHQSVLLRGGDKSYLLAGDASFDQTQLLNGATAGIAADPAASRRTLATIRDYCAAVPTVYLPSHDPETPIRLAAGQTIPV